MNTIRKLKKRKGFTMVELIIVIAIIGILLAMILPNLLTSNKDTQGKGFAKEFFYKTQDFVSRQKLVEDPDNLTFASLSVTSFPYIILYAQVAAGGSVSETGMILYKASGNYAAGDEAPRSAIDAAASYSAEFKNFMSKFEIDVNSYIAASGYECTYYAIIDRDFRVHAAYWTDCDWDDLVDGNASLLFTDNCINGGYYSCAYPVAFCDPGKNMFTV